MKVLRKIFLLAVLLLTIGLVSCDDSVYDDLSACPYGVNFMFHSQTPCETSPTYPTTIKETKVFAFDESGVLLKSYSASNIALTAEYKQTENYNYVGTSSFVAWGGEDLSKYDFSEFVAGKTTQKEMLVALKRQADKASAMMPHLFVGTPKEGNLIQKDYGKLGTHFDDIDFNMQQLTNTLDLTLTGLKKDNQYDVKVVAANSRYDIFGATLEDERCDYIPPSASAEEGVLKTNFRLLKLEENKDIRLVVTNQTSGKEVYSVDLIDGLIKYKGSPINLACEHNFVLSIELKEQPDKTYIAVQATINQWNIVFRDVEL